MSKNDKEAVVYIAAAVPFMLWGITRSYLKMKRRARVEGKIFYQTLLKNGVDDRQARELTDIYADSLSITSLIKEAMRSP